MPPETAASRAAKDVARDRKKLSKAVRSKDSLEQAAAAFSTGLRDARRQSSYSRTQGTRKSRFTGSSRVRRR